MSCSTMTIPQMSGWHTAVNTYFLTIVMENKTDHSVDDGSFGFLFDSKNTAHTKSLFWTQILLGVGLIRKQFVITLICKPVKAVYLGLGCYIFQLAHRAT